MALLAAICFEGLGRKLLPTVPQSLWYFLKDVVLVAGIPLFGIGKAEVAVAARLYRGFGPFLVVGVVWTVAEIANPQQSSLLLAILGLRAYWLWWIAPVVLANALRSEQDRAAAIRALALFAVAIAAVAAVQFEAPGDAAINAYAWGTEEMGIAGVAATGRVRVSSTFSYLTGFTDFAVLSLTILLAVGLGEARGWTRVLCFAGAGALGATIPMSGSRGPLVLTVATAIAIVLGAGFVKSREGRAIVASAIVLGVIGWLSAPAAVSGVESRFQYEDTAGRFAEVLEILPPLALARNDYPLFGIGTGMQQNARVPLGVRTDWWSEGEPGRLLIELGIPGYLMIWMTRLGLVVALLRAMRLFQHAGRRALAGGSLAVAGLTVIGNLTFDHVWQSLYFTSLGIILQAATSVVARPGRARSPSPPVITDRRIA